jgi:hypothetical protein
MRRRLDLEFAKERKNPDFYGASLEYVGRENKQAFTFRATELKALWENCLNKKICCYFHFFANKIHSCFYLF